jgi:hypothetical protein
MAYEPEGSPIDAKDRPTATAIIVGDGYFDILRVPPLRGRVLTSADHAAALPAAWMCENFEQKEA